MYGWFPEMHLVSCMVLVAMVTSATAARCECHRSCCGKLCGLVFMLMLILTVCSASNINKYKKQKDTKTCNRGTITPRDPYFFEGEDIVLNCSRPKGGWRALTFLQGPNSKEVPEKYITKLNRSAIQLRIPNISREDVDRTEVSTFYRCVNKKNTSKCYDNVYVSLEYYLRTPVNLTCRDYNFDRMTCSWSLGVEEYHLQNAVNVTCGFKNGSDVTSLEYKGEGLWESCPHLNNTACYWDPGSYPAPAPDFDVMVKVLNVRRNNSKVIVQTFSKYDIVEPAPVSKLSHNASSRCLQLKWKPPKRHLFFVYDITYKSPCSEEKSMKTFSEVSEICDLVPHTKYYINVKARVVTQDLSSGQWVERGHWSSPKDYDAMTHADVVDVNPKTLRGLYDISPSADGHASVTVYWTPLPSCDLHDTPDSVTYNVTAHNVTSSVKHPAFSAQINVPEKTIINVTLQASNSVGHPESSRVVTVYPSTDGPHPSELIIQFNRTNEDCVTTAEVVVRENSSQFFNITHTIVWCKGRHHVCEEPLEWKELEENVTSFIFPSNLCDDDYSYGLVTNGYSEGRGQIVHTGIQWEECIYKLGEVPKAPLEIYGNHLLNGFFIKWGHYDCSVMKAYITHYQVTYCSGDTEYEENCKCTGEKRHNNISRQHDNFSVEGLPAGDKVCVWVQGISKAGPGPEKSTYIEITDQTNMSHKTIVVVLVCIAIAVVIFLFIIVFRLGRKKCKSYKEKNEIRIPEYAEESRDSQVGFEDQLNSSTRLISDRTSGIGTVSGNEHIYQDTETTEVVGSSAEIPFLNERDFKGYKDPESLYFDEDESDNDSMYSGSGNNGWVDNGSGNNGLMDNGSVDIGLVDNGLGNNGSVDNGLVDNGSGNNGTVDNGLMNNHSEVYDGHCNETSNVLNKQESLGSKLPVTNHNKNGISVVNFKLNGRGKNTELERSFMADKISDIRKQEIGKNFKASNNNEEEIELKSVGCSVSQPSESQADEEEILTSDHSENLDGYEGVGSTYSDNERPEVNTDVEDKNEEQDENTPVHPDFLTSSTMESFCKFTNEPVEKYDSKDLELGCENEAEMTTFLSDAAESESDMDSIGDISSSDVFISGYKQSKDICSLQCVSGSIASLDSMSHKSADQESETDFTETSGGENMINKESSTNESNHGNSGTSDNLPNYIRKRDPTTFEKSEGNFEIPVENGKRKNVIELLVSVSEL